MRKSMTAYMHKCMEKVLLHRIECQNCNKMNIFRLMINYSYNQHLDCICISMVAYFCHHLSDNYVTFFNQFSRYVTNVINITVYPENAKSHWKQLYHPPETVMSPAGYIYVTEETVISPSPVLVLHTNQIGFEIQRRRCQRSVIIKQNKEQCSVFHFH